MGRSISRSFDALLDSIDDPRRSIEQTLTEMRQQLRAARREVVGSVAAEKQLRARVDELTQQLELWTNRAELAVRSGDDELARAALHQRKRVESEKARAEQLRADQLAHALEMKRELERMEQRIQDIESRKGTLAVQLQQTRQGGGAEALGAPAGGSAFSELRRLEAEIEGVELAVQAQREVEEALRPAGVGGMSPDEVEARFRQLEAGVAPPGEAPRGDVEEELQAMKRKYRIDS